MYDSSEEEDAEIGDLVQDGTGGVYTEGDVLMQDNEDQRTESEESDEDPDDPDDTNTQEPESELAALTRSNTLLNSPESRRRSSAADVHMEDWEPEPRSGIIKAGPTNILVASSWREMQERQISQVVQRRAGMSNGLTQLWDIENGFDWKEVRYDSQKSNEG
jgi:hypothetical protein